MKHLTTLVLLLFTAYAYATPIPQPDCLAPKPAAKHLHHAAKAIKVAAAPLPLCEAQRPPPIPWTLAPPVLEPPIAPPPVASSMPPPDEVPAALPPPPMLYPMSWYEPIFSEAGSMEFLMPPSVQYNVTQTKAGNVSSAVYTSYVTNNIDTTNISNVTTSTSSVVNNAVTNTTTNNKTVIVNAPPEHHERVQKAPELDSSGAASAATFLIGCVLVLNGRRPRS